MTKLWTTAPLFEEVNLNWLFELRSVGDYGVSLHVGLDDARRAVGVAEDFFKSVKNLLSR